ncbi:MAG: SHOCT domain-containing protein [Chryseobacterium sp.]|nr:SHOCT domain-containing protein [Chryseobacterium sp.]
MRTIITKRNFLPLILFALSVVLCWCSLSYITSSWKLLFDDFYTFTSEYKGNFYETKAYNKFMAEFEALNITYAINLSLFSLILFFYIIIKNQKGSSILLGFLYLFLAWLIITNFEFNKIDTISTRDLGENFILILILFSPYLYFILFDTIIGVKIDIAENIISNKKNESNNSIEELHQLREKGIISSEQFSDKRTLVLREQIKTEFLVSNEYKTLLGLKDRGMFTKQEFDEKIEEIINKKLN